MDTQHLAPPLLHVQQLCKNYHLPRRNLLRLPPYVAALRGVDVTLHAGRSLGIVGESGSGPSAVSGSATLQPMVRRGLRAA